MTSHLHTCDGSGNSIVGSSNKMKCDAEEGKCVWKRVQGRKRGSMKNIVEEEEQRSKLLRWRLEKEKNETREKYIKNKEN